MNNYSKILIFLTSLFFSLILQARQGMKIVDIEGNKVIIKKSGSESYYLGQRIKLLNRNDKIKAYGKVTKSTRNLLLVKLKNGYAKKIYRAIAQKDMNTLSSNEVTISRSKRKKEKSNSKIINIYLSPISGYNDDSEADNYTEYSGGISFALLSSFTLDVTAIKTEYGDGAINLNSILYGGGGTYYLTGSALNDGIIIRGSYMKGKLDINSKDVTNATSSLNGISGENTNISFDGDISVATIAAGYNWQWSYINISLLYAFHKVKANINQSNSGFNNLYQSYEATEENQEITDGQTSTSNEDNGSSLILNVGLSF